jgi:hypothetical protein
MRADWIDRPIRHCICEEMELVESCSEYVCGRAAVEKLAVYRETRYTRYRMVEDDVMMGVVRDCELWIELPRCDDARAWDRACLGALAMSVTGTGT